MHISLIWHHSGNACRSHRLAFQRCDDVGEANDWKWPGWWRSRCWCWRTMLLTPLKTAMNDVVKDRRGWLTMLISILKSPMRRNDVWRWCKKATRQARLQRMTSTPKHVGERDESDFVTNADSDSFTHKENRLRRQHGSYTHVIDFCDKGFVFIDRHRAEQTPVYMLQMQQSQSPLHHHQQEQYPK